MRHEGIYPSPADICAVRVPTGHIPTPTPHTLYFSEPPRPTGWGCEWYDHFRGPAAAPWAHAQVANRGGGGDLSICGPCGHALADLSCGYGPKWIQLLRSSQQPFPGWLERHQVSRSTAHTQRFSRCTKAGGGWLTAAAARHWLPEHLRSRKFLQSCTQC